MCGELYYRTELAWLWVESVLYGLYVVLFSGCAYIIVNQRRNRRFLVIAVAMFALSSARMFVDFVVLLLTPRVVSSLECIGRVCTLCPGADAQSKGQLNVTNLLLPVMNSLLTTNQLIADGLLIYRCFIVWGSKHWIIVPPTVLLLATSICAYFEAYVAVQLYLMALRAPASETEPPPQFIYSVNLDISLQSAYTALTLATNILVTGLIAWKIWRKTCELESLGRPKGKRYRAAAAMIIESGGVYATTLLIFLLSAELPQADPGNYEGIADGALAQLVGIVPTLIIIRVGLGRSSEQTYLSLPTISQQQHVELEFASNNAIHSDLESATIPRTGEKSEGIMFSEGDAGITVDFGGRSSENTDTSGDCPSN